VVRLLGRGGMGAVYEAIQLDLGRRVAVKVLTSKSQGPASTDARTALRREAVAAARLGHPNIVAVTEYSEGPPPVLVMEYLEGRSLGAIVRQGPLPPVRAVFVVMQVLSALAAAHAQGIVHRDVKPENVFLIDIPGVATDFEKVLDFGIAKELGEDGPASMPGAIFGTPSYMAPEQVHGGRIDARADIYATGSLLYHLLAGVRPYAHMNGSAEVLDAAVKGPPVALELLAPHLPKTLVALVARAMERDVSRRTLTAMELRQALDRLVREERWTEQPRVAGDTRPDYPALGPEQGYATVSTSGPLPSPTVSTSPPLASNGPANTTPIAASFGQPFVPRGYGPPPSAPTGASGTGPSGTGPSVHPSFAAPHSGYPSQGYPYGHATGAHGASAPLLTPLRVLVALAAGGALLVLVLLALLVRPMFRPGASGLPHGEASITTGPGCHADLRDNVVVLDRESVTLTSKNASFSFTKPAAGLPPDGRVTLSTKARMAEGGAIVTLSQLSGPTTTFTNLDSNTILASAVHESAHDPVSGTLVVHRWDAGKGTFDLELSHVVLVDPQTSQPCKLEGRLRL
jgi:serine/threonine-protein kinase